MFSFKRSRLAGIFSALLLVFSMAAVGTAEARMGGSFGSRGMRTFQSAPTTMTAPRVTAPIQNSMTRPTTGAPAVGTQFNQPRPGFWGGFGGGLLGGLLFSGLFGSMFGMGFGGLGGGFFSIIQLLLVGGLILWAVRRFRAQPATAGGYGSPFAGAGYGPGGNGYGSGYGQGRDRGPAPVNPNEIGVGEGDLAAFERTLGDVQSAFSREDHQGLRRLTTPEMVSFLSEELAENATRGLRNEVSDLRFIRGDLAEAWREGSREYATVAMNWSAIDVLRDRVSGAVVKGDEHTPLEATELWTFVREAGGDWQLAAIQEAGR